MEHTNTRRGKNTEFFNFRTNGTYILKSYYSLSPQTDFVEFIHMNTGTFDMTIVVAVMERCETWNEGLIPNESLPSPLRAAVLCAFQNLNSKLRNI
jgi:hypothetical protein